jgi:hypothetical protein
MSVTVRTNPITNIVVNQGSQVTGAVTVKTGADLTVQGLKNVVSTDLQDGYTLVWDETSSKWVTQQIDGGQIASVDGGTY